MPHNNSQCDPLSSLAPSQRMYRYDQCMPPKPRCPPPKPRCPPPKPKCPPPKPKCPPPKPRCEPRCEVKDDCNDEGCGDFWTLFVWFIIILIVVCILLFIFKPNFVLKTDEDGNTIDEIDNGKAFGWSVFIALILVLIFWLFSSCCSSNY